MFGNEDLFHQAVRRLYKSWTALQLAVEHYEGRGDPAAKAVWLENDTVAYFRDARGEPQIENVEDCLEGFLNDEFNTLVEDGSVEEIARKLVMFGYLLKQGDLDTFRRELNRLPSIAGVNASVTGPGDVEMDEDDVEMLEEGLQGMNVQGANGEARQDVRPMEDMMDNSQQARVVSPPRRPKNEPDEEGFTTVSSTKNRRPSKH